MKITGLLVASLFLFLRCGASHTKIPVNAAHNPSINSQDTLQPLLRPGGCYAIEIGKNNFAGGILIRIAREEGGTYYSFLLNGKFFSGIPAAAEFRKGGVWGRKIPSGMSGESMLTFDVFSIEQNNLALVLNKFFLVETPGISRKNAGVTGSSSSISLLEEIARITDRFASYNARIEKEKSIFPEYPYEVVSWSNVIVTSDPDELVTPEIIWQLTKNTAHPKAVKLFNEDWFWSESDDLSPFGNDDGSDALYLFKDWREKNPAAEPALFLDELEARWQMSFAHKNSIGEDKLPGIEQQNRFYRNIDRSIIAVALGQIALEGKISPSLKELGIKAVQRAMTPYGMNGMSKENQDEYKSRFMKILNIFNQL